MHRFTFTVQTCSCKAEFLRTPTTRAVFGFRNAQHTRFAHILWSIFSAKITSPKNSLKRTDDVLLDEAGTVRVHA